MIKHTSFTPHFSQRKYVTLLVFLGAQKKKIHQPSCCIYHAMLTCDRYSKFGGKNNAVRKMDLITKKYSIEKFRWLQVVSKKVSTVCCPKLTQKWMDLETPTRNQKSSLCINYTITQNPSYTYRISGGQIKRKINNNDDSKIV